MRTAAARPAPPLRLRLPATSANLGPGFDAAACALDLWLEIEARVSDRFRLSAMGRDRKLCAALKNNLLLETYREMLAEADVTAPPLALRIRNEIPLGKGCGSSAAARLAAIQLAAHFGRMRWPGTGILAAAAWREGHADNAAACWHGGFVCVAPRDCWPPDENGGWAVVAGAAPRWPLLLAVPRQPLATEEARAILPAAYSRADAVANLQAGMQLAAAFLLDRRELLAEGMRDRWHEPYRERLCPLLTALKPLAGTPEAAGVCLSGAGPSVLLVPARGVSLARLRQRAAARLREAGLQAELIATRLAPHGAGWGWKPA